MSEEALNNLRKVQQEIRERNIANLKPEDRPATDDQQECDATFDDWFCTKPANHEGDHVAHGCFAHVFARWSK